MPDVFVGASMKSGDHGGANALCGHRHRDPRVARRCATRFVRPGVLMFRGDRTYEVKPVTAFEVLRTGELVIPPGVGPQRRRA